MHFNAPLSRPARHTVSSLDVASKRSRGKTAEDMFIDLKLDKKGGHLFENPALVTWVSYVNKLDKKFLDEFSVINILMKHLDADDMDLARVLTNAEFQAKTKGETAISETIGHLRQLQFRQWMNVYGLDLTKVSGKLNKHPDSKENLGIILSFRNFYKANGGIL
ncbi:hypothetical protein GN244_ATG20337 [Phytophthora infestans]|uniref:Uncharacterized protein n=1 Tax=Phytophthora infestans TaxID=4787 RepID=A0A833W3C7_PHYIN|nr:hypothetical protein GN244_ATG20337 [Phytophthora infestans]KAF4138972.1 hypothetical protein GN958_ATG11929 [Phytophthora infestans]